MQIRLVLADSSAENAELDRVQRELFPNEVPFGDEVWLHPDMRSYWIMAEGATVGMIVVQLHARVADNYDDECPGEHGMLYLQLIGCAEAVRRMGVSTAALKSLMELAREEGFERIMSNLRPTNRASLGLHLRMGFRQIDIKPNYYPQPNPEDTLLMQLDL